ncbi:MAG: glycoside hydrolase family 28 protein [Verrucomicrobia bacterium]|nr:glycoside hydrolase family 28 protein [Verrucomicrobiota bacterium]
MNLPFGSACPVRTNLVSAFGGRGAPAAREVSFWSRSTTLDSPRLRRRFRPATTLWLVVSLGSSAFAAEPAASWGGDPIAPIHAPFPMPPLARPTFPSRIVSIADHGAVVGGTVKNTEAFARAIRTCAEAGGGRVLVPAGKWLTGPIHLRSRIDLHLAEGAEVIFSDRFEDYLPPVLVRVGGVELHNYSPLIYARDCDNVAITGPGRLNGNAKAWWPWKTKETKEIFQLALRNVPVAQRIFGTPEAAIRPNFVVFLNCRNVLFEGFTIGSGPNWTLHPVYCENVIIRRVHVLTDGPNNDGIDPDSCRNVLVEHCVFDTGDDCVVLKSGYNEDGWRVARPTENVVMRWCSSKRGHGGLVIGSEMSGDVRNVYMHDCQFDGTDHALRIKSRRGRGGVVERVWAENLVAKNMKYDFVIMNMDYSADRNKAANERAPVFRDIHVRNLRGEGAPAAVVLQGLDDSPVQGITFENLSGAATKGFVANGIKGVTFRDIALAPAKGPVFALSDAQEVEIRGAKVIGRTEVLVALEGTGSKGIRISACQLGEAKAFVAGSGVAADAVTIHP